MTSDTVPTPGPATEAAEPPSGVRRRAAADGREAGAAGDVASFLATRAPPPEKLARKLGVALCDAEDIRQEASVALLESSEVIESPAAWFWQTALRRKLRLLGARARARRFEAQLGAHVAEQGSPFPSPDAALERRDRDGAIERVLSHIKPVRRDVAALRLSGHDEKHVAAELGIPVGTVRSQWQRAKDDLRAAAARENVKSGERSFLAAVLAALAALLLWLVARGRRGGAVAGQRHAGGLLACAALAVFASHHGAPGQPPGGDEAAAMATDPRERAEATGPADGGDAAARVEQRSPLEYVFLPALPAFSEREREAARPSTGHEPSEVPRRLLIRAQAALREGDLATARAILAEYEGTYPHDPNPMQHSKIAADVAAP